MSQAELAERVEAMRRFTRFYTRRIGVLHEGLLGSPLSLTEARVVFEIAHHESTTAGELARELGLDPGYLSRLLKGLDARGLLERRPSDNDGRQTILSLSPSGEAIFARLNARSRAEVGTMLDQLAPADQARLVEAMAIIKELLDDQPPRHAPVILRPHQPGDIGWVIARHGALYAQEYRWDESFEALVAEVAAKFLRDFDPKWERCWIAERDGDNVGCVFLVRQSDEVAKLRLLLIEPSARGLGLGKRLVEECIRFARLTGYRQITLWTNDILTAARTIYVKAGFKLVSEEPHHSFGHDLVGQTWELEL